MSTPEYRLRLHDALVRMEESLSGIRATLQERFPDIPIHDPGPVPHVVDPWTGHMVRTERIVTALNVMSDQIEPVSPRDAYDLRTYASGLAASSASIHEERLRDGMAA